MEGGEELEIKMQENEHYEDLLNMLDRQRKDAEEQERRQLEGHFETDEERRERKEREERERLKPLGEREPLPGEIVPGENDGGSYVFEEIDRDPNEEF